MEVDVTDLDQSCARQVLEVVPAIMRHIAAGVLQELGDGRWLTMGQFRLLHLIQKGVRSVSDLARCESVSQPTISRQVDGLVAKGLVIRLPDADDRRMVHLQLTQRGAELLQSLETHACRRVSRSLRSLTATEKAAVLAALALLRSAFDRPTVSGSTAD